MENKHSSIGHPWENCQAIIEVNTVVATLTYPLKNHKLLSQLNLHFVVELGQV